MLGFNSRSFAITALRKLDIWILHVVTYIILAWLYICSIDVNTKVNKIFEYVTLYRESTKRRIMSIISVVRF